MRCAARFRPTPRRRNCPRIRRRRNDLSARNGSLIFVFEMTACLAEFILPMLLRSATPLADGHMQSALDPAGVQAHSISKLWWGFFWVTAVVYVLVIAFMFVAIARRRRGENDSS